MRRQLQSKTNIIVRRIIVRTTTRQMNMNVNRNREKQGEWTSEERAEEDNEE